MCLINSMAICHWILIFLLSLKEDINLTVVLEKRSAGSLQKIYQFYDYWQQISWQFVKKLFRYLAVDKSFGWIDILTKKH